MKHPGDIGDGLSRLRVKVGADLAIWTVAGVAAFALTTLETTMNGWAAIAQLMVAYLILSMPIKVACILRYRLHRQTWRRVTFEDIQHLGIAVGTGAIVLFVLGLYWFIKDPLVPATVPLLEGALAFIGMGGARAALRWRKERRLRKAAPLEAGYQRVLLVGAGDAGTRIGHEMRRRPGTGLQAVGFLDDNPAQAQLEVAGLRVLGTIDDLEKVVEEYEIDQVLIAMPSAGGGATRRVVNLAQRAGVACRILPGITQVISGDATLAGVRSVQVEDLLRREQIELDLPTRYISGRTVLVTGAGGSIGSELVRQVALLRPAAVVLFDHGENALYDINQELTGSFPALPVTTVIGDVRDAEKIRYVMHTHRPTVVFHAAAHKHVPLLEGDPDEAVLNNVGGTKNLAEASLFAGVERFVNVSTDKAVRPASVLGATKRLAERVVEMVATAAAPHQCFVSVRFGNVLGSSGSVVPAFQEQIRRGGPVTVTDPEMTRYFMTIPEATHLVIQAGSMSENGALYVLNMGTPVRIVDLARDMIHLAGADDEGIEIVYTGRRPGEKLHEELFTDAEQLRATVSEQIVIARQDSEPDLVSMADIDALLDAARRRDWATLLHTFQVLLPGFDSDGTIAIAGGLGAAAGRTVPGEP